MRDDKQTWRKMIAEEMEDHSEEWSDIVESTFTDGQGDKEFDI